VTMRILLPFFSVIANSVEMALYLVRRPSRSAVGPPFS
jgi:hypothetical protein